MAYETGSGRRRGGKAGRLRTEGWGAPQHGCGSGAARRSAAHRQAGCAAWPARPGASPRPALPPPRRGGAPRRFRRSRCLRRGGAGALVPGRFAQPRPARKRLGEARARRRTKEEEGGTVRPGLWGTHSRRSRQHPEVAQTQNPGPPRWLRYLERRTPGEQWSHGRVVTSDAKERGCTRGWIENKLAGAAQPGAHRFRCLANDLVPAGGPRLRRLARRG